MNSPYRTATPADDAEIAEIAEFSRRVRGRPEGQVRKAVVIGVAATFLAVFSLCASAAGMVLVARLVGATVFVGLTWLAKRWNW